MIDVIRRRCLHDSCTTEPSFNVEGSKSAAYCKQHVGNGMVKVTHTRRCSNGSCTKQPGWGVLADMSGSLCGYHKGDIAGSPVINF